jgi:hypothetical protein
MPKGEGRGRQRGSEDCAESDREDQEWERQQQVGGARYHRINPLSVVARDHTQGDREHDREKRRQHPGLNGGARPPQHSGEDIASEVVRAHYVREAGLPQGGVEILSHRAVGRDHGRQYGGRDYREGKGQAEDRWWSPLEPADQPPPLAGAGAERDLSGAHEGLPVIRMRGLITE